MEEALIIRRLEDTTMSRLCQEKGIYLLVYAVIVVSVLEWYHKEAGYDARRP